MSKISKNFYIDEEEYESLRKWRRNKEVDFHNNMIKFFEDLKLAAKKVTKNKKTAIKFLKQAGIMNKKGELDKNYKIENK